VNFVKIGAVKATLSKGVNEIVTYFLHFVWFK